MAPDNFKTYDELKEKLIRVISCTRKAETVENVDLPPHTNGSVKSKPVSAPSASDDDDDTLSYFSKLAEDE